MSELRQNCELRQNYESDYLKHFDNFIDQLKIIFPSEETLKTLSSIKSCSNEEKIANGQSFCSSIREYSSDKENNFDLFLKSKIKVFSHKSDDTKIISESLFGDKFCLKNLLNNQPEDVKKVIWTKLHTLYMISELLRPVELYDQEKVNRLNQVILASVSEEGNKSNPNPNPSSTSDDSSNPETKAKLQEMLGVDVNKETTSMIDDIVGSFEKVLTNQSNANPLAGIMEISQNISVKYADKINNGEIELDKLMQAITKKVPGMDQMMSGMMGGTKTKAKEKILIDENFSTANINVGMNKEPESQSINIASILKMADQMGVIPGGNQPCGDSGGIQGLPDMGALMKIMGKLESTSTSEEAAALKLEMDTFLQKNLGVDVDKLNEQLDSVTKQMELNKTEN
jgi:hypothetical protein